MVVKNTMVKDAVGLILKIMTGCDVSFQRFLKLKLNYDLVFLCSCIVVRHKDNVPNQIKVTRLKHLIF